jgi:hypothetical protein
MKNIFQILKYLQEINEKLDHLTKVKAKQSVIKQFIASKLSTQGKWQKILKLPWHRMLDVKHVFEDSEREVLFQFYVHQLIPSGKKCGFPQKLLP